MLCKGVSYSVTALLYIIVVFVALVALCVCVCVCVCAGLKVRLKSEPSSTARQFDYARAPFSSSLRTVPWADLTSSETTYSHLRLHQLSSETDSLSFFLSTTASLTANIAVILINIDNSFSLAEKFLSLSEDQMPLVPVVMVTKETGAELLEMSKEHFRDVEAMIELPPGQRNGISSPSSPHSGLGTVCTVHCASLSLSLSLSLS